MAEKKLTVFVTDAPYNAKGDGLTNDRAAIQQAIDDAYKNGGGTVVLTEGRTFLSGNLILRDNVELHFEDNTTLLQSSDPDDYVRPTANGCEPHRPQYGYDLCKEIRWSHMWYYNYPMIFAPEGTNNIKVTGKGTLLMMPIDDIEHIIRICPIGFFKVSHFEISDITITNYHSYAMMPFHSNHGLIKNLTVEKSCQGNGDGFCIMNCQNIRVTGCKMDCGDDAIYIFSSYKDPRGGGWWNSDEPQPSINFEIDHNECKTNHCKAFGMILWGLDCPDQEKIEVRNVYIHDNHFETMGNWIYCPYTTKTGCTPVTKFRFENNRIDAIEPDFFATKISDMNYFHSMREIQNGGFESGLSFWSYRKNTNDKSVGVGSDEVGQPRGKYGYISHLDEGDAALYQGLFIRAGELNCFWAKLQTSGDPCRIFVKDLETQELVAEKEFCNTEWEDVQLEFSVPKDSNYHIGIERGKAVKGWARMDNATLLGNCDAAFGYKRVGTDPYRGMKPLYFYDPELWK